MVEIITKSQSSLEKAIALIKNGGVIVFPTDTVYGLICDATNKEAVQKLFQIKKRDLEKPIPVFVKENIEDNTIFYTKFKGIKKQI